MQKKSKLDTEIVTRISGPEVGYVTTPITLVQCALILIDQRHNLPKGGVLFLLGLCLVQQIYKSAWRKMAYYLNPSANAQSDSNNHN